MNSLTIGVFDGVHLGHQHLLSASLKQSSSAQLITFSNHPSQVISKKSPTPLCCLPLKLALLKECGFSDPIVLTFDQALAKLHYRDFLAPYSFEHLIIGDDAAIGYQRQGTPEALRNLGIERGFTVHVLPKRCHSSIPISSTRIRTLIQKGSLQEAEQLLGRPYCLWLHPWTTNTALPPDGNYNVWAHSPAGIIQTTLYIENQEPRSSLETPQLISFGPNLNPQLIQHLCHTPTSLAVL